MRVQIKESSEQKLMKNENEQNNSKGPFFDFSHYKI